MSRSSWTIYSPAEARRRSAQDGHHGGRVDLAEPGEDPDDLSEGEADGKSHVHGQQESSVYRPDRIGVHVADAVSEVKASAAPASVDALS
ncbi:MAG: hypothetical protein KDB60_11840, partial [Propionibacteriaceae bacterium]|nr:hypothetical protein [Propionibacteriaceae bacterium]